MNWASVLLVFVAALWAPAGGDLYTQPRPKKCTLNHHIETGMDCHDLGLEHVPPPATSNIQALLLSYNRIRDIYNHTFENYPYLRHLYLDDNSISYIESAAFNNLVDLEVLDLTRNSLHFVPDAIYSLPVVWKLKIGRNPFAHVQFLEQMPSVKHLDLSDSRLKQFPILEAFPGLEYLNVSYNKFKMVKLDQLSSLCTLKQLDVQGNKDLYKRRESFCDCALIKTWSSLRGFNMIPSAGTLCAASQPKMGPLDEKLCDTNETQIALQEANLAIKSCEVSVLEYGSGPFRIRSSVYWTIGVLAVLAAMFVFVTTVYCSRRRRRRYRHSEDRDTSDTSFTTKGTS